MVIELPKYMLIRSNIAELVTNLPSGHIDVAQARINMGLYPRDLIHR